MPDLSLGELFTNYMQDSKPYSHTEDTEETILFDEDMSENLSTYEEDNGQLIYRSDIESDTLSNLEEIQNIYVSFNNNEFINLPLGNKIIDSDQAMYFFGELQDSEIVFSNYPCFIGFVQYQWYENNELKGAEYMEVHSLTEFNHVTIKTVTKTETTTITPEFEYAVKHIINTATADDIQNIIKNYGIIEGDEEGMVINTESRMGDYGDYYATLMSAEDIIENYQTGKNIVIHIEIPVISSRKGGSMPSEESAIQLYMTLIQVMIQPNSDPEFIFAQDQNTINAGIDPSDGALTFYLPEFNDDNSAQ